MEIKMEPKPEASARPEFLCCNEGYTLYRDNSLSPKTVRLYAEDGRLLAMIPGVHSFHVAPLSR